MIAIPRKLSLIATTVLSGTFILALSCGKSDDDSTISDTLEFVVNDATTPIDVELKYGALAGTKIRMPAGTLPAGSKLKVSPAATFALPEGVTTVSPATNISITQADGTPYQPISADGIQIITPIKMPTNMTANDFVNAVAVAYSVPIFNDCTTKDAAPLALMQPMLLKIVSATSVSSYKSKLETPIELLGAPTLPQQTLETTKGLSSLSLKVPTAGTFQTIVKSSSNTSINSGSMDLLRFASELAEEAKTTLKTMKGGELSLTTLSLAESAPSIEIQTKEIICEIPSTVATVTYSVGGTVSGLSGTLVLQNNSADDISVTSDGTFTFSNALAKDADYLVTVKTQPTGQTCTIANGSGKIADKVTNVAVTCSTNNYLVTPSGSNVSINPNTPQSVSPGSTQAFTVTANAGYLLSSTVGGTCPSGTWSGNQYTTGAISAACTITFSGSSVKIIKLSSTTTDGNLGADATAAIAAADSICGSGYKALLGNTARNTSTDWPLAANTTYVRADGTTIIGTTDANKVFSSNLTNPVSATSNNVWAGFVSSWSLSANNCTNWTTNNSATHGGWGLSNIQGDNWYSWNSTSGVGGDCNNTYYLYCVQQ